MKVDKDFGDNPNPGAVVRWRQKLERLQELNDRAVDRAEKAHRLLTQLLQKQGQYQAELNAVNGQISGAQAAAAKARNLVAELAARTEEHRTARDAATARLLGMMQTNHPLVLLPVRL